MSRKTTIIAEIGENHFGCMDLAKGLVHSAANAGADVVKFQSYRSKDLSKTDADRDWFRRVELSNEQHFSLQALAIEEGTRFSSSPFTLERAQFLVERMKLSELKIASGKMRNLPLLAYLNNNSSRVKTIYISTGTASLGEIRNSVERLSNIERVVILHCVSSYPCADEDANLSAITNLKNEFPEHEIGYSDHTVGIEACVAAVALGAAVLEKHFTYNSVMPGDDHLCAMTPQDLKLMIQRIERIESMLGSGVKEPCMQEKNLAPILCDRFGE